VILTLIRNALSLGYTSHQKSSGSLVLPVQIRQMLKKIGDVAKEQRSFSARAMADRRKSASLSREPSLPEAHRSRCDYTKPNVHGAKRWSGSDCGFSSGLSRGSHAQDELHVRANCGTCNHYNVGSACGCWGCRWRACCSGGSANGQAPMHEHVPCTLSGLSSSGSVAILRVSECLSGLHQIRLYRFRAGMTDGGLSAGRRPPQSMARQPRGAGSAIERPFDLNKLPFLHSH